MKDRTIYDVMRISTEGPITLGASIAWWTMLLTIGLSTGCISPCDDRLNTDMDGDGLPDATDRDKDGDGWKPAQGDCNDCDPGIGPNYVDDTRDGVDQDCDGVDGG